MSDLLFYRKACRKNYITCNLNVTLIFAAAGSLYCTDAQPHW